MSDYDTLLSLVNDERVKAGLALNKDIGFKFALGQTRHVWRYGTLSDGHEKITDAQRYFQANKEIYNLSHSLEDHRFVAMEAKADLLEAEEMAERAVTEVEKLRADAKIGRARARMSGALDTVQDQLRGLDELCKIAKELEPKVLAQYPNGVEQAEMDNWTAVLEYRVIKERVPGMQRERMDNICLPPDVKAVLGYRAGRMDAIAPLLTTDAKQAAQIERAVKEHDKNTKIQPARLSHA